MWHHIYLLKDTYACVCLGKCPLCTELLLCALQVHANDIYFLILSTVLWDSSECYPYFTEVGTKAQGWSMTSQRSPNRQLKRHTSQGRRGREAEPSTAPCIYLRIFWLFLWWVCVFKKKHFCFVLFFIWPTVHYKSGAILLSFLFPPLIFIFPTYFSKSFFCHFISASEQVFSLLDFSLTLIFKVKLYLRTCLMHTRILGGRESTLSSQAYGGLHMSEKCMLMWNGWECKLVEKWTIKRYLRRAIRQNARGSHQTELIVVHGKKETELRLTMCMPSESLH